jgi:hypothetical protein
MPHFSTHPIDPHVLDVVEREFIATLYETVEPELQARHGIRVERFGPVLAASCADLVSVPMLNLVLGAGERGGTSDGHLAAAIDWIEREDVEYYVPLSPGLPEAEVAETWLSSNGFSRGYSWMKFVRTPGDAHELREPNNDVVVREIGADEGDVFGFIVQQGFGLPDWATCLAAGFPSDEHARCYLAEVGGEPVACGATHIVDGVAEFGLAATLEAARGKGCQQALLARRIADADAMGCTLSFVETGERTTDRPSASYRNILRAGFSEAYLRPNWQRQP